MLTAVELMRTTTSKTLAHESGEAIHDPRVRDSIDVILRLQRRIREADLAADYLLAARLEDEAHEVRVKWSAAVEAYRRSAGPA